MFTHRPQRQPNNNLFDLNVAYIWPEPQTFRKAPCDVAKIVIAIGIFVFLADKTTLDSQNKCVLV